MDRNKQYIDGKRAAAVATREGGVDRNVACLYVLPLVRLSPPARVAWIEIQSILPHDLLAMVATREGGVDRNIPALPATI